MRSQVGADWSSLSLITHSLGKRARESVTGENKNKQVVLSLSMLLLLLLKLLGGNSFVEQF